MRTLIFILFMAAVAASQVPPIEPGVSHELAKWRAQHYSDVRYKLNLTLEKMSPVLKGTIEIRMQYAAVACAEPDCPPVAIVLDWRKIKGHEEKSTISNVSLNGQTVVLSSSLSPPAAAQEPAKAKTQNEYREENEHLVFRDGVRMGENVIKLDFTSPILTSGSAITRYVDKEDGAEYIYSLFVPSDASTAFPVFDQPDLKARFNVCAQAPADWVVVSNSLSPQAFYVEAATPENWFCVDDETKPISTYVFAFAAGPWEKVSEPGAVATGLPGAKNPVAIAPGSDLTPTSIYVRKSQAAKFKPHAAEVFRLNREGIKYLEEYFDYKFPFPKYDIVLISEFPFGGMEHAGATFLREDRVIFPTEPSANDYITRANLIFHEAAHQWFGNTVTMRWFDDLWLKEGFAEFMAYKTLEKVMPEYNAWKIFYERNKQAAYLTDSTKGTTPIYQPIANLNAAKSAYGNIVYRKAPSFLKQAEFYIGPDKFQTAVRAFLKKYEFANAGWEDLVKEFEAASGNDLLNWSEEWIKQPGRPIIRSQIVIYPTGRDEVAFAQHSGRFTGWRFKARAYVRNAAGLSYELTYELNKAGKGPPFTPAVAPISFVFSNYRDYGYGIFLLDDKSRDYALKNIHNEKDDFLRSMMWGSLWDSVREAELDPKLYVELVLRVLSTDSSRPPAAKRPAKAGAQSAGTQSGETDESTIQTLLGRVSTALNYYVSDAERARLAPRFEDLLIDRMQKAATPGQRVTYFRAFLNNAVTERGRMALKQMLADSAPSRSGKGPAPRLPLRTKDRFEVVTRLAVLGDPEAAKLLAEVERTETSDEAARYAYAARAAFGTAANKAKYWNDFVNDKKISESWIEAAFVPFNSISHAALTQPYLTRALTELPNLKRDRKIFFINGWLAAFIGGQRDEKALAIVNKFLADNPNLDNDLRLKILENVDLIERAVKIRGRK